MMEELYEHVAASEGGEEVIFVAVNDCRSRFPKRFTLEKDVVDGIEVAAVGAGHVVVGPLAKAG